MLAQTTTKFQELINRLNELADNPHVNELALRRVKRDAQALRAADPVSGHVLLGVVACIEGDVTQMHEYHQTALTLEPSAQNKHQYAVSLARVGLFSEALALAEEIFATDQTDLTSLEQIIDLTAVLGLRSKLRHYSAIWRKLCPDREPIITDEEIEQTEGVVREDVLSLLESDLKEHRNLWADLAKR